MKKMSILMLVGRRWFNKTCGNTYHSCEIYVDGDCVHKIEFAYGYGDHWQYNGMLWLDANGYLPGREKRDGTPGEALWRYCERMGIKYSYSCTDVPRKKDL